MQKITLSNGIEMPSITLNDGLIVPSMAFGPGIMMRGRKLHQGDSVFDRIVRKFQWKIQFLYFRIKQTPAYKKSVLYAIQQAGFRWIDYSASYDQVKTIGECIKKCGIPRRDLIVTTRITNRAQFTHTQREAFLANLKELQLDYVDVLMFHWPVTGHFLETWKVMESLKKEGFAKSIGVANCHQHHLEDILNNGDEPPSINQFEQHPWLNQISLVDFCKRNKIVPQAYAPTARQEAIGGEGCLMEIANKHKKTPTQIILRWHIQNGVIPVVRALNPKHQCENIDIFNFELSVDDMEKMKTLNCNFRVWPNPDNCDFKKL
ncbi:glyoxal reductase [Fibrobacterales bacterium]|nr:glyoxal reductase [Fibrobacterales bacterium]